MSIVWLSLIMPQAAASDINTAELRAKREARSNRLAICRGRKMQRTPSAPALVVALLLTTGALVLLAADHGLLGGIVAFLGAVPLAMEFARMSVSDERLGSGLFRRMVEQAESGRRLAIYDRETGLFAHWYIVLRGQEECARAARYERPLSVLVIEPQAECAGDWSIRTDIGRWLQTELRVTDVAGYLGNGRYVVLAPEADPSAVARLVGRLRERVAAVDVGASVFPQDGGAFEDLWRNAAARLPERGSQAA